MLEKKDTLCVLPTGYGKSIIYQLLPFMFECYDVGADSCIVLVISPLNALMLDQINKLKRYVNVAVLKAGIVDSDESINIDNSRIIFAHPEALLEDKKVFQHVLKSPKWQEQLKAIVVDEAHLIVEW